MTGAPEAQCPRCGHWQEDYDGIYCWHCNYCAPPSGEVLDDGSMICDICGARVFINIHERLALEDARKWAKACEDLLRRDW